jgi:hypothetical protein
VCDVQVLVAFVLSFVVTRLSETILFSAKPHYTLAQAAAHVAIGGACLMAVLITLYAPFTLHLFVIIILITLTIDGHFIRAPMTRFLTERRFLQDMRSVWHTRNAATTATAINTAAATNTTTTAIKKAQ